MEYDADIFDAVEFDDLETIKLYWAKDTNIDWQDNNGTNLLMLAVSYNHKEIVKHLLTLNPNLYLRNNKEETVFQLTEKLEDKEIFKSLIDYCWKDKEKLFLFEYYAKPKFESEILGAFINCWMMDEDFDNAKFRSQNLVKEENWEIASIKAISEIKKGALSQENEGFEFYQQSIIDKEVLVFHTYDNSEVEGNKT